jgi:hypothetical protein
VLPPERQIAMVRAISAGKFTTSEQVKHACIALRDAESQLDAFGEMPRASEQDLAALSRLERKINLVADMIQSGFKEGECVAAQRVSPDRLILMADRLVLVRKHVLQMEHDLRRVATTTDLLNDRKPDATENPRHQTTVGVSDRPRTKGRREQNVADTDYRGTLIVHASKRGDDVRAAEIERRYGVRPPSLLPEGGIIGITEIVDCVRDHRASGTSAGIGRSCWRIRDRCRSHRGGEFNRLQAAPQSLLDLLKL